MTVVNTNVKALFAQNALSINNRTLNKAMQELSTGVRINSAKDDAAGLAISTRMSASLRGMTVAIRNANDGISMMQTAEGALGEISNMLQRMRELSAQAATGSLASSNRQALQAELDQLVAEIDNVAKTTNFNGIKLLDGSASAVSLQTGVNEGDQVTVEIEAASSKQLGLQGYRIEGQVTSGRVGTIASQAVDDVLINGKNAIGTAIAADKTAAELASLINENIGQHRVQATAYNTVKGVAPTSTVFAAGDISIGGTSIGAAGSVEELVANINRDAAGVSASLAADGTIELSNNTGNSITVGGTSAATIAKAGLTGGTYKGFITLNSLDDAPIVIQAKNSANGFSSGAGLVADVKNMGFNESTNGTTFAGGAVSSAAIALSDDLRINGVQVGASADASALSKAVAINKLTAQTGVVATARTQVVATYSIANIAGGSDLQINGKTVNVSAATTIAGVVSAINTAGVNGVVASTDADGRLILTSESGADITVTDAAASFISAIAPIDDTATTTATAAGATIRGRITLSSETGADIRVESKTTGAAGIIGFADQGGASTLVGGALRITTQADAGRAITAIDTALDSVAMNRANLGAFQNRLTAAVDNLSSSSTNLSEARGRIMDTDYAKATTELARSQIIQQAATAMLAQANQQPQTVLSLLQ